MTDSNPVTALLMVLDQQLMSASHSAKCAYEAAIRNEMNLAIGTLLPAQQQIYEAAALFHTIISLHREARSKPTGGAR